MENPQIQPDIEKGMFYLKKFIVAGLYVWYSYKILAVLDILPGYHSSGRCGYRRGSIICLSIDPSEEFFAWLVFAIITTVVFAGLSSYFLKREKHEANHEKRLIMSTISSICRYVANFNIAFIIILLLMKALGAF